MKELLKLGVYTLLGTLLLSAPFAGLGMLSTHLVTEKTFWIQLIALFLSAVSLQDLWLNPSKGLCPWTYVDILPLSLLGLILLSYPYSIHPEPEKLLFIGQMVVLWYLLRQVFHEYPVLIGYFSMFFRDRPYRSHLGLPSITGMGLFEPFPVSADRLFFQSGALFRIFGDHITGGSWHLAGTVQTKYALLPVHGMYRHSDRCTSCGNEPIGMDSGGRFLRLGICPVPP